MFGAHVKIRIPRSLHDRLKRAASEAGYAGVDEMIQHALERAAERFDKGDGGVDADKEAEKQLRGLGYIE